MFYDQRRRLSPQPQRLQYNNGVFLQQRYFNTQSNSPKRYSNKNNINNSNNDIETFENNLKIIAYNPNKKLQKIKSLENNANNTSNNKIKNKTNSKKLTDKKNKENSGVKGYFTNQNYQRRGSPGAQQLNNFKKDYFKQFTDTRKEPVNYILGGIPPKPWTANGNQGRNQNINQQQQQIETKRISSPQKLIKQLEEQHEQQKLLKRQDIKSSNGKRNNINLNNYFGQNNLNNNNNNNNEQKIDNNDQVKKYGYTTNNFFRQNHHNNNQKSPNSINKYKNNDNLPQTQQHITQQKDNMGANFNQFEEKTFKQIINEKNNNLKRLQYNNAIDIVYQQEFKRQQLEKQLQDQRPQTTNHNNRNVIKESEFGVGQNFYAGSSANLDRYEIGPTLGQGSYAVVKLAKDIKTNKKVAIKTYEKFRLMDAQKRNNVKREITNLQKMKHENIIKLYMTVDTRTSVNLVMEFVGNVSLRHLLKSKVDRRLPENEAQQLFYQLIQALKYCHKHYIVHRDIKLENILVDSKKQLKLIDFGFSVRIHEDKKLNVFCGTPSYMAPEIIMKKEYIGRYTDIWSSGILLYVLLFGQFPFRGKNDNELHRKIAQCDFQVPPNQISKEAQDILEKIIVYDPKSRLTAKQILEHEWFSQ